MQKTPKRQNRSILLTGGHAATTSISVVEEIKKRNYQWKIYWIGPNSAMEGKHVPTLANKSLPRVGVECHNIVAGRLQRKFTKWSIISLLKFPLGFIHALLLVQNIKPNLILSFGGYVGYPVVVVGWVFRIPIVLHDQTYSFNRANKSSARFAKKIAISRDSSRKYYPKNKTVLTGNPIMSAIKNIPKKKKLSKIPTIYVTGGSSGARSINNFVEEVLEELLENYKVIHQVGYIDYKKFSDIKGQLSQRFSKRYKVFDSIDPGELGKIYTEVDVVVARSGANTVSELIAVKIPSILIPLEIGKWDEQVKNAKSAESLGISKVLRQSETDGKRLLAEIKNTIKDWDKIIKKTKNLKSPDTNASQKLVDLLERLLN